MAGTTGGAGLLESCGEGSLIARIGCRLEGTQLRHHISIGRLKAGAIGPNAGQGTGIA
jgi:hypothetical protein